MGATAYSLMALPLADDAEWMSGKSRNRLAPVLTKASSWTSDRRAQRGCRFVGEGEVPNREGTLVASSAAGILRKRAQPRPGNTRPVERPGKARNHWAVPGEQRYRFKGLFSLRGMVA